ncbi:MAG: hypothetical protein K5924_07430 [Chloroflexi bacterium]|nr:hypothetical protein [Chloroflexota bacterium]
MRLAFLTGALASGVSAAGLAMLAVWVLTLATGSDDPWGIAPLLAAGIAMLMGIATYAAERIAHRRSLQQRRSLGEPWAFRD